MRSLASAPSALLVVSKFGATIHVLHLVPEDGAIERFSLTTPSSTFCHGGATDFLNDIEAEARARKLWNSSLSLSPTRSVEFPAYRTGGCTGTVLHQHIEFTLSDCPVNNEALQDLAAELLTVVDNKIKGAVLRRRTAVHVKRFVIGSAVGVELRITAVDGTNHFNGAPDRFL
ncbi:hypothetical protein I7I51_01733 [Histoplasma capsulatum]|uniref:Uncharacterized protein n=1 Tax=Ajellomyces capsulatus TaxID=5037 RepID=A0A8A1MJ29_AJECA|nr:hypothetical protein I7I51_01733 [Histoplasma capsulatum]